MVFYVVIIVAMPFLYWIWLGIMFTVLCYALNYGLREGLIFMVEAYKTANRPSRLIRYTTLDVPALPGVLSIYNEEKNLILIDRERAATMPDLDRQRLEMSDLPATKLSASMQTLAFVPYHE